MFEYYSIMMVMIVFSMIAMVVCLNSSGTITRSKKHYFRSLFICIAVATFCEWFGTYLQGTGNSTRILHIIVKVIELSIAPAIAFLITAVIEVKFKKVIVTLLGIHAFVEILSGFFGFIYKIDENSNYTHEKFYWIYIAAYIGAIIYLIYIFTRNMKKYQYNGIAYFSLIITFTMLGIIAQLCNSELKVVYVAIAIAALMLYVFTLEMIQQNDELTGLINRRGFENYTAHIEDKCVVLIFDIDNFKLVNDSYGHKCGDLCLKEVGKLLKICYAKYGKCFRIGGDEFCVITTKKIDLIEEINREFLIRINQYKDKNKWMPDISLGYVFSNTQFNNIQDAVSEADRLMYKCKEEHCKK